MDPKRNPGVQIDHIFVRSCSFQHRGDPLDKPANTPIPEMRVELEVSLAQHSSGKTGALSLTVRTDPDDERALYDFNVEYTLIASEMEAEPNMTWLEYAARGGLPTLYPFIREAIANLTSRGRFGAVWLKPINLTPMINELIESVSKRSGTEEKKEVVAARA